MRSIIFGHNDPDKLARAIELRQTMTPAERRLWQRLRANRLLDLHFRRQVVIEGFVVDFYCHSKRLAVEVDGGVHADTREYDAERDKILRGCEIAVLRVTNEEVEGNLGWVLDCIVAAADRPTPPSADLGHPSRGGRGLGEG
ncbi:MAG TPA: DUF559 domain-containing protein [Armatimonadota bacterium]|jgi:very-short-patch-repair endonuclease